MTQEQIKVLSKVYSEILMNQKEIVTLLTPTWKTYLTAYTPLIAAVLSGAITIIAVLLTFKLNRQNNSKEKFNDRLMEYYSDLYEGISEFVEGLRTVNQHNIRKYSYVAHIKFYQKERNDFMTKHFQEQLAKNLEEEKIIEEDVKEIKKKIILSIGNIEFQTDTNEFTLMLSKWLNMKIEIDYPENYDNPLEAEFKSSEEIDALMDKQRAKIMPKMSEYSRFFSEISEKVKTKKKA